MKKVLYLLLAFTFALTACDDDDDVYVLLRDDVVITVPEGGLVTEVGTLLRVDVKTVSDEGVRYLWKMGQTPISHSKTLDYVFEVKGQYALTLTASQSNHTFDYYVTVEVKDRKDDEHRHSPYITKVFDYVPAVGQFVNELPKYVKGNTQEDMNRKVLNAIGNNNLGMITLGGFGGYVVIGFDHTIKNVPGKRDFRILGNAFESNVDGVSNASSEPGIVMVAYDANHNGIPDDEWYELAGSAHRNPEGESWIEKAKAAGNDTRLYRDYEITYYRPDAEPKDTADFANYIAWDDNQGNKGFKVKNTFHVQPYYPLWVNADRMTFKGTCLPQNGIDQSGDGSYFVCHKFRFGYADNDANTSVGSTFDISWAMSADGRPAQLEGVDFIKIYTGVNQENGWLGECSTEVSGAEDLHILGEQIDTEQM